MKLVAGEGKFCEILAPYHPSVPRHFGAKPFGAPAFGVRGTPNRRTALTVFGLLFVMFCPDSAGFDLLWPSRLRPQAFPILATTLNWHDLGRCWSGGTNLDQLWRLGLQNTTKIPREDTREGRKERNFAAGEGKKKREILAPPPFGPPFGPQLGPHPSGPPPFKPPRFQAPTLFLCLGPHPFGPLLPPLDTHSLAPLLPLLTLKNATIDRGQSRRDRGHNTSRPNEVVAQQRKTVCWPKAAVAKVGRARFCCVAAFLVAAFGPPTIEPPPTPLQ